MVPHPENQPGVFAVPTAALVMAEKAPGMAVVLVLHENPHPTPARPVADILARGHVLLPDDAEEQGTGAVHDGDVGELPVLVVGLQRLNHQEEEGVGRGGAHGVVGDARGGGAAHPGGIGQQRVEPAIAPLWRKSVWFDPGGGGHVSGTRKHVHRPDRGRCHRNGPGRSSGWHLLAGWVGCSCQRC